MKVIYYWGKDGILPPNKLSDFIEWAQDLMNSIPKSYKDSAKIDFDVERDFEDCSICIEVSYKTR